MFDTGTFSRMARVSKRTLRYYDSIDLFKPAKVDAGTGIRYYDAHQFADLNRILALKELGMSLDQIRRTLRDDISQDEIRGMLMMKKAEAETALLEELYRFRSIEARLQNPEVYLTHGVVLKEVPEQAILSYRRVLTEEQLREIAYSIMGQVPRLLGKSNIIHYTTLMHDDAFDTTRFDAEIGFSIPKMTGTSLTLSETVLLEERLLPAVDEMATVVVVGGPSRYPAGFTVVGQWVAENGYDIAGPQREIFLNMPTDAPEDEIVIELQFPVRRRISDTHQILSALD